MRAEPKEHGRSSRFYGSHTGGAWLILFMIFNVIWTYALFRGSAVNVGNLPYGPAAFFSHGVATLLEPLGVHGNEIVETVALLLHIGVMLVFLLIVLHSKHLHIGLAPLNVTFKRLPNALGPLLPMESKGDLHRLRGPRRGRGLRPREDRGLHLEGLPRLHHVHRVWPLPVAVPGVEHRKAVVPQADHHGPARSPVRQGSLHLQRSRTARREHAVAASARTLRRTAEEHHVPESGFGRVPADSPLQATRPLVG